MGTLLSEKLGRGIPDGSRRPVGFVSIVLALALAWLLWLLLVHAQPAQAGGVVTTCDEPSLRAALAGGGSVTFNCADSSVISLSNPIVITTSTNIDGSNGGNLVTF